ncbi:MAG TPA: flavoprotein [Chloroflexota bacterium]|nr:flavoprotein [Chloroflexota bacterium]
MPDLDHVYLVVTAAATARRAPEIAQRLAALAKRLVILLTPNTHRIVAARELVLALERCPDARIVESYFDGAILPRPPDGVVLVAPCSFDSLNKLAYGVADNLALSVVAEAIGRATPVIVAVSVNPPLWAHPRAQESVGTLRSWGAEVIDPVSEGETLTLAPTDVLVDAVRRALERAATASR